MSYGQSNPNFGRKGRLDSVLGERKERIRDEIERLEESYLMQVNEQDLVEHLVAKHTIEIPSLLFDHVEASTVERMVRAEDFPSGFNVTRGHSYKVNVVHVRIPGEGEVSLFANHGSTTVFGFYPAVEVRPDGVHFEVPAFGDDPKNANRVIGDNVRYLQQCIAPIQQEIATFNHELRSWISSRIKGIKQVHLSRHRLLDGISVSIKNRPGAPSSYSVPTVKSKERVVPAAPVAPLSSYSPDPTMDDATYRRIVDFLFSIGKGLERLPATYAGKDEEAIRDHLVLMLDTQFEGNTSVTAETFNKKGKTDILVRHNGSNLFVAECKFWRGPRSFQDTIDQALGYLTWRDSKAAIVVFDKNVGLTKDLDTIHREIKKHPKYLRTLHDEERSCSVHEFHLADDRGLVVTLAVLVFHFPTNPKMLSDIEKTRWLKHELDKYKLDDASRNRVIGSAGSVAAIPDLMSTLADDPDLVTSLDRFMNFALDNELGEIFEQICVVDYPTRDVRIVLKKEE